MIRARACRRELFMPARYPLGALSFGKSGRTTTSRIDRREVSEVGLELPTHKKRPKLSPTRKQRPTLSHGATAQSLSSLSPVCVISQDEISRRPRRDMPSPTTRSVVHPIEMPEPRCRCWRHLRHRAALRQLSALV